MDDGGVTTEETRVLDPEKVKDAIDEMLVAIARLSLTVTEAIMAVRAVDASFRANYTELYEYLEKSEK